MSFPFSDFERNISADIVQKGIQYYAQGYVKDLKQDGIGWNSVVVGTCLYRVSLDILNGEVTDWNCDCPYDHGPICKHVAAVLYAILDDTLKEVIAPKTDSK